MNKYGISDARYNQLISLFGDEEEVAERIEYWGVEDCNNGYAVFDFYSLLRKVIAKRRTI